MTRNQVERDRYGTHDRLVAAYFFAHPKYNEATFRMRFRMSRRLFTHIVQEITNQYPYFQLHPNCAGKIGISALVKCTFAIRQMAYDTVLDALDEYLQMGATTARDNLVDALVNEDNDSEVEDVYDETATYRASTSFNVNKASNSGSGWGNKTLYEQWQESHCEDPYDDDDDDFDDPSLTDAQMKFDNAFILIFVDAIHLSRNPSFMKGLRVADMVTALVANPTPLSALLYRRFAVGYVVKQMEYVKPSLPKVQRNLQTVHSVEKSGENEVDFMKRARGIYQDKNKNSSFNHEKAWAVLRKHAKWDAPDPAPVDLTEDNVPDEHFFAVNTDELFGPDAIPRPPVNDAPKKTKSDTSTSTGGSNSSSQFGDFITYELRLKREAAKKAFEASKDKDRMITRLEELRFIALSTKDLSPDDAEVFKAKTFEVLKVVPEHNDAYALTNVLHGLKFQHCLELLCVGVG
uniref:Reverse transcriptase domain-containing protein n=1 Tax=Tanacetum cinerariifolium TaxID=118510 RepID=A0A6L2P3F4_TANCI|nr:reverse transcriptase domain-containing protein [Tanacetum cinerariifolium]